MRQMTTAAVVLGAVLLAASTGTASPTTDAAQAAHSRAKAAVQAETHSMKGVVKSIDATTLIVERGSGKHKQHMTFALDTDTHRDGDIKAGSTVSVRYRTEAQKLLALNVEPVKAQTGARKTSVR